MYYIMRKSYYVMHKLLRYAKNVLRYAVIITLCGNDYVMWRHIPPVRHFSYIERGSSVVECRTRNHVSPGSNPPLLSFRRLGIFVLSVDTPVD